MRAKIKDVLARVARETALSTLLRRVRMPPVLLPLYHALSASPLPHLRSLYPVRTPTQFAEDLDFLLRYFQPLHPTDLPALAAGTYQPDAPSFLITFDDGFRSFATEAAPLLAERGLAAICFLNPAFVDNRELMHRCKASVLIDRIAQDPTLAHRPEIQRWRQPEATGPLSKDLLAVRYPHRKRLDTLAQLLGIDWPDWLAEHQPYLTSDAITALRERGFYFGAHSMDHPEYALLDPAERRRQTFESSDWVRDRGFAEHRYFALPFTDFGLPQRFFTDLNAGGIEVSFGTAGLKGDTAPRHLQRVPFETAEPDAEVLVKTELLYYLLKSPLGRNQIQRS